MKKSELTVGQSVDLSTLRFAESFEKDDQGNAIPMPSDCIVTHVNVMIPVYEHEFNAMDPQSDINAILVHAGDANRRYKRFEHSRVPAKVIINHRFFKTLKSS